MAKKVDKYIKLQVAAGKANPAPPVGPEHGWTARRLRDAGIRNAPGLVTAWLREPAPAPVRRLEDEDPIAAERQRFLGGPLGWVVRS